MTFFDMISFAKLFSHMSCAVVLYMEREKIAKLFGIVWFH